MALEFPKEFTLTFCTIYTKKCFSQITLGFYELPQAIAFHLLWSETASVLQTHLQGKATYVTYLAHRVWAKQKALKKRAKHMSKEKKKTKKQGQRDRKVTKEIKKR